MDLDVYIDGACSGNPGPAGIGGVFYKDGKPIKEFSKPIGEATNNIAEYRALIYALEQAKKLKVKRLKIFTDSQLMCSQLLGKYKVKNENLKPLFDEAQKLANVFGAVSIKHVPREQNKEADRLAVASLKTKDQKQAKAVASAFKAVDSE